jgi:hypothetical protein
MGRFWRTLSGEAAEPVHNTRRALTQWARNKTAKEHTSRRKSPAKEDKNIHCFSKSKQPEKGNVQLLFPHSGWLVICSSSMR